MPKEIKNRKQEMEKESDNERCTKKGKENNKEREIIKLKEREKRGGKMKYNRKKTRK
jgi:hypothetical protein